VKAENGTAQQIDDTMSDGQNPFEGAGVPRLAPTRRAYSCSKCRDSGVLLTVVHPDDATLVQDGQGALTPWRSRWPTHGPPLRIELCGCIPVKVDRSGCHE